MKEDKYCDLKSIPVAVESEGPFGPRMLSFLKDIGSSCPWSRCHMYRF